MDCKYTTLKIPLFIKSEMYNKTDKLSTFFAIDS